MDTITPDWTSLPRDLLTSIAKRLHTRIDILRFRAVCRSFRCILPCPPKVMFPESILRTTDFLKGPHPDNEDPFVLSESTVYTIQPLDDETSQPWLVQVEESTSGKVQMMDPLFGFRFKSLPNKSLNLLDYRVKEISKSYVLESASIRKGKAKLYDRYGYYKRCKRKSSVGAKVVFSSFLDETDDGFAVMAKIRDKKLSVWRNVDKKWTNIDLEFPEGLVDIVYRNHKFYTLTYLASTVIVDSKSLTVVEVSYPGDLEDLLCLYLVEFSNVLLLIAWYHWDIELNKEYEYFMVFKLDEENSEWVQVTDGLKDRVFFLGGRSSYSIVAEEFSGYRGNYIYFRIDWDLYSHVDDEDDDQYYPDVNIYNLKYHTSQRIVDFPNPFWPPPAWVLGE